MHAYLITGATPEIRQKQASKLIEKNKVGDLIQLSSPANRHHIQVIRDLRHRLSLKPRNTQKKRAVLLEGAQLLTQEAANSFLKTLEEPPQNTIIILTAPSRELVLETISSRTALIDLGPLVSQIPQAERKKHARLLERLLKSGVGERFSVAEEYSKNRNGALNFVIGQTFAARKLLFNRVNNSLQSLEVAGLLERLDQARQDLEANVNVKLTIYDLLMHYP